MLYYEKAALITSCGNLFPAITSWCPQKFFLSYFHTYLYNSFLSISKYSFVFPIIIYFWFIIISDCTKRNLTSKDMIWWFYSSLPTLHTGIHCSSDNTVIELLLSHIDLYWVELLGRKIWVMHCQLKLIV
jgi:hypothetical protein